MSQQNQRGRFNWMRDNIWQFIWGLVGVILTVITIIITVLALPQAAPIRQGFVQVFKGKPIATATMLPTPTPTPSPTPTVLPTETPTSGPQLLYKADFVKNPGIWQAGGFTLSGSALVCSSGNCSIGPDYIPPNPDYSVVVKVQLLGNSGGFYINGRINSQYPGGTSIGYDGQVIYTTGNSGAVCFPDQNVNTQFAFTESVTYVSGDKNLDISQSGLNIACSLQTSDVLTGKSSLVSNGALKLISFEIYST